MRKRKKKEDTEITRTLLITLGIPMLSMFAYWIAFGY